MIIGRQAIFSVITLKAFREDSIPRAIECLSESIGIADLEFLHSFLFYFLLRPLENTSTVRLRKDTIRLATDLYHFLSSALGGVFHFSTSLSMPVPIKVKLIHVGLSNYSDFLLRFLHIPSRALSAVEAYRKIFPIRYFPGKRLFWDREHSYGNHDAKKENKGNSTIKIERSVQFGPNWDEGGF